MNENGKLKTRLQNVFTRPVKLMLVILILFSLGGLGYVSLTDKSKSNESDSADNNKEKSAQNTPKPEERQTIDQIQRKILAGEDNFENRISLAEQYAKDSNVKKANFNLEKARLLADSTNESHASRLAAVEQSIK